jgi:hypothetical protein
MLLFWCVELIHILCETFGLTLYAESHYLCLHSYYHTVSTVKEGEQTHTTYKSKWLCVDGNSAWMWEVAWSSGVSASERWWEGVWEKEWDAADVDITNLCKGLCSLVLHPDLYVVLNFFCLSEWQINIFVIIHKVASEQMFSEPKLFMWEHYKSVGNMWGSHFELW